MIVRTARSVYVLTSSRWGWEVWGLSLLQEQVGDSLGGMGGVCDACGARGGEGGGQGCVLTIASIVLIVVAIAIAIAVAIAVNSLHFHAYHTIPFY